MDVTQAMNDPIINYQDACELWRAIEALDGSKDLELIDLWQRSQSPLRGGRHGAEARSQLVLKLKSRMVAKQIVDQMQPCFPDVEPSRALVLGDVIGTELQLVLDLEGSGHYFIVGKTGCGKTTLLASQAAQFIRRNVFTVLEDFKSEGRRLTNRFANVAVFRPDQMPINMLEPIGRSEIYWLSWFSEFGRAYNLRPETWTKVPEILARIEKAMKPSEPYPSLKDMERVLGILADKERRPTLQTVAQALASLNSLLGKTAFIRKAPSIEGRYAAVVHEYQGLPPRIQGFLAAINLLRLQLKSSSEGHNA